jgi:hypothetical protein
MKRIYHLHIPRTSGFGICKSLWKTFIDNGLPSNVFSQDVSTLMYDHIGMIRYPFVSGHFAINPIVENPDGFDIFSLVRDPVEHYISIAAYVSSSTGKNMSNDYMDEFLYGNITPFGVNELFSSAGNIQTKMLFCRIAFADKSFVALRDDDVQNEKNIIFLEHEIPSEDAMKDRIYEMNIFDFAKRDKAVDWLKKKVLESYGFELDDSINHVTNFSNKCNFKPDISHIREIKRRSEADCYLYELVSRK